MTTTIRWAWPTPGRCRVCGCTDDHACPGGCFWVDKDHTVCSTCGGTEADAVYTIKLVGRLAQLPGGRRKVVDQMFRVAADFDRRRRARGTVKEAA